MNRLKEVLDCKIKEVNTSKQNYEKYVKNIADLLKEKNLGEIILWTDVTENNDTEKIVHRMFIYQNTFYEQYQDEYGRMVTYTIDPVKYIETVFKQLENKKVQYENDLKRIKKYIETL